MPSTSPKRLISETVGGADVLRLSSFPYKRVMCSKFLPSLSQVLGPHRLVQRTNPTAFVLTISHAYIFMGNGLKHSLMGRVRHGKEPPER